MLTKTNREVHPERRDRNGLLVQRARVVVEAYAHRDDDEASRHWCDLQVALMARMIGGS